MRNCDCNSGCNSCGGCKPACYSDCSFDISANPYNPNEWVVTYNGMSHKILVPGLNETDTKLSANYSNATLNYKAEKHDDVITGAQLGDLMELGDLRDVNFDPTFTGTCTELVYRKYADCGEGCSSPADQWSAFNINSDGAKQDWIQYVRGANAYGCPVYLDVPTNLDEFWFAGWRLDGEHKEFGYYQAKPGDIPTDDNGDPLVVSIDQTTKQPIIGSLKITKEMVLGDAICSNIIPAEGFAYEDGAGVSATICYYPRIGMAKIYIDFMVSAARGAEIYFNKVIGTIENSALWPIGNYYDLPCHWVWANGSDGSILPVSLRFNSSGQLLMSGSVTARAMSGKTKYIVTGVDDMVSWLVRE